jgi:hypothetical protein
MSADADYLKWRQGPDVGCMFARIMSRHPDRFQQKVEVIGGVKSPEQFAAAIAACVDVALADTAIVASTLVIPELTGIEALAKTALALREHPKWTVDTIALNGTPGGDVTAVRIVRDIPFQQAECPSEVLVLGPFDIFPATRRAPVTAFEIFVGEPLPNDPKNRTPTTKANLAHISFDDGAYGIDNNKVWEKSKAGRLNSLGGIEDSRAKAKVAFVMPTALALQLGCAL